MALAAIMAPGDKRLARAGKRPKLCPAIVAALQIQAGPHFMDGITRKFTLRETRSKQEAIVDAIGSTGYWPFRRIISYHVGINCDAIAIRDVQLHVQRCGRTIAVAVLPGAPKSLRRLLLSGWGALLHPRHASTERSPGIKWEDLLRPRRPK